jgi:phosphoenolpyruvate phosphomutase
MTTQTIAMQRLGCPSFRSIVATGELVRVAGAHSALGGIIAQEAGFQAIWASSLEISASRGLPDASLLTMTDYLQAAASIQRSVGIPVVADCDSGFGNNLNVAYMVQEYEAAGITAISIEDKTFPKMNSFVAVDQALLDTEAFAGKVRVAKAAQRTAEFFVIARTEALIAGLDVSAALARCHAYADAGADAVLIHSKATTNEQVLEFLEQWGGRCPVVIVPTTYPDWHADDVAKAGVSVVIYANQGLRATIACLRETYSTILEQGQSVGLEPRMAKVDDVFALQRVADWLRLQS